MSRVLDEIQLDFCDVLIKPKRTTLNSRKEANILRSYEFKYYPHVIESCGIMAANMATTGTFEMRWALEKYNAITCLHKHYTVKELENKFGFWTNNPNRLPLVFISTGLKDDKENLFKVLRETDIDKVCVDIANGYIPNLIDFVKELRGRRPDILIMAGNVVTGDMVQDLIMAGADIVKVGIGPGCFTGDMLVLTNKGKVPIQDIKVGDYVLTHKGHYQEVTNKFVFDNHKELMKINNIKCTPNHEFYVINKKDKDLISENNLNDFAYWVSADELDKNLHLLIKR